MAVMNSVLKTKDNYEVRISVFNHVDYSAYVFVADSPNRWIVSTDAVGFIRGRDTYEVLIKDGPSMTKSEIKRMFNL